MMKLAMMKLAMMKLAMMKLAVVALLAIGGVAFVAMGKSIEATIFAAAAAIIATRGW